MHKSKYIAMVAAAAMALTLAGCGGKGGELIEVTPTPMATPTPTVVPATVTPLPTSTPAPKMIGTKTAQAKFIYLSNSLQSDIRELYLRTSGNEDGDWGKNLISMESSIKAAEQVQMYYGGETSSSTTESGDSSESTSDSTSANYDMKLVTADGNSYEIYSVNFGDMEKASLMLDDSTSSVYLRYMSLSTKKQIQEEIQWRRVTAVMRVQRTAVPATVLPVTAVTLMTAVPTAVVIPMITLMTATTTAVMTAPMMIPATAVMIIMTEAMMTVTMAAMMIVPMTTVVMLTKAMTQTSPAVQTGIINKKESARILKWRGRFFMYKNIYSL